MPPATTLRPRVTHLLTGRFFMTTLRTFLLLASLWVAGCASHGAVPSASAPAHAAAAGRVFELRTYTTHEGRLDALLRRFRNHTVRLFEKHGMTNIGYWVPQDSARSHNTLVYILAHPSRE